MDVRAMRSFLHVAKSLSFSRAATSLRVSQSTVSNHAAKLEKELGGPLFDRQTRPVQLTPLGVKLLESVEPFLAELDALRESARRAENNPPIRIAATNSMAQHFLPEVVGAYRALHPNARIRIELGEVDYVLDRVECGEIDIGFTAIHKARPTLAFRELFKWDRILLTPLGHPLLGMPLRSLSQLCPWPLIMQPEGMYPRLVIESAFRKWDFKFEIAVEMRSYEMMKKYVNLGVGVAIVPAFVLVP
ncbi:MAG: LysR family transcriptional regulator, partial [Chloroflexota bacterium]|nr:LysR family transcriptional regulator [Chloroflexota bacterium]